jgi:hypothetical protein
MIQANGQKKLPRLPASKQKRLNVLMVDNNEGKLTKAEREKLRKLVKEAEQSMGQIAQQLAKKWEKAGK